MMKKSMQQYQERLSGLFGGDEEAPGNSGYPIKRCLTMLVAVAAVCMIAWRWEQSRPIDATQKRMLSGLACLAGKEGRTPQRVWSEVFRRTGVREVDDLTRGRYNEVVEMVR